MVSLILTIFLFLVLLFRNEVEHVKNVCFYWYRYVHIVICKTRFQKWLKSKICSLIWKFWKWAEKGQKNFDPLERGLEPQIFNHFPPMIWIFMEGEGDEIKSKQASKRDTTLQFNIWYGLIYNLCWKTNK